MLPPSIDSVEQNNKAVLNDHKSAGAQVVVAQHVDQENTDVSVVVVARATRTQAAEADVVMAALVLLDYCLFLKAPE